MIIRSLLVMCTIAQMSDSAAQAESLALIPAPTSVERQPGSFTISNDTKIVVNSQESEVHDIADYLIEQLTSTIGRRVTIADEQVNSETGVIVLNTVGCHRGFGDEGYSLIVEPTRVFLSAPHPHGLFLGVQTIRQLLTLEERCSATIPCLSIFDQPRYRWRGMLLDCCRHFMSKEFVKRYIDLLAFHKMNVLHWHLTEDQGWRIEIKKYPKLTEIGSWRNQDGERYGGFYTQDDIREIVAYAKSRYITVVPEIEMPGHSLAALASYPELGCVGEGYEVGHKWGIYDDVYCAGEERVFQFLEDVLAEVRELFPSEYIHIGGDECPKTRWKVCDKCQARIEAEGLADEHELQSYFVRRMEKHLNQHGRRIIGWDEILEGGLAPNATVQSWRGMDGAIAAARAGHDVISSPTSHCYLDYTYQAISLERIYSFEPTPAELTAEEARHVLGAEGNIWTERAPQELVDRQVFPRLCALSEVVWSPAEARSWDDFLSRMQTHYRRLDALGVAYYVEPPQCSSPSLVFDKTIEARFECRQPGAEIRYTLDGSEPTEESSLYTAPFEIGDSVTVKARTLLENGRTSEPAIYRFRRMTPREPAQVGATEPGMEYAYFEGAWRLMPEFDELKPVARGICDDVDLTLKRCEERFGFCFEGFFEAPQEGTYEFFLESDDGSRLWMGEELIVDHDGLHGATEKSGEVILRAGLHPVRIEYFQAAGAMRLKLRVRAPGEAKRELGAGDWKRGVGAGD